jgi:pre-mRNA-splicing factor ISY1
MLLTPRLLPCFLPLNAAQAVLEWEEKEHERQAALPGGAQGGGAVGMVGGRGDGDMEVDGEGDAARFVAYVPLPDQKEIEARVLEKKKADLLAKYTSDALQAQQETAKSLLNIQR